MRDLNPTGRTAKIGSLEDLQELLQPFAGTVVEQFLDNPDYPTELRAVVCDVPERGDFDPSFRYLHLSVGENPSDPTLYTSYAYDRNNLPTLKEIEGDKILIEEPGEFMNLLLPSTPGLLSKLIGVSSNEG